MHDKNGFCFTKHRTQISFYETIYVASAVQGVRGIAKNIPLLAFSATIHLQLKCFQSNHSFATQIMSKINIIILSSQFTVTYNTHRNVGAPLLPTAPEKGFYQKLYFSKCTSTSKLVT